MYYEYPVSKRKITNKLEVQLDKVTLLGDERQNKNTRKQITIKSKSYNKK